jgi:hypothetical protein
MSTQALFNSAAQFGRAQADFGVVLAKYVAIAACAYGAYIAFVSKKVPSWVEARQKKGAKPLDPRTVGFVIMSLAVVILLFSMAQRSLARGSSAYAAFSAF